MISASALHEHNLGFHLHRQNRAAEAEPHYRKAIALAPDFKEAWLNLGLAALTQKRPEEALACQLEALRLDPLSADAYNNLGMAHYAQGHIAEAGNYFQTALRLAPDHANAMLNLGSTRQILNDVEGAEALFRHSLALGVDPAPGNSNLALALMEQGQPEKAERVLRQALAHRPGYPEARVNLALALLTLGKMEEGWAAYESRWAVEAMGGPAPDLPQPRWTGQTLNGETVLLYAEQGFGDVLQFCRYAPMVAAAGGRVVLVVPKALRRVMATLDGVDRVLTEEDDCLPAFDYHCPLLSLPFAFDTRMDSIPGPLAYLAGDPAPWADVLAGMPGLKIGLVWAGKSRTHQPHAVAIDQRRSMRLADMAPLLDVPGCSFVSLQLGPPAARNAGSRLRDVSERLTDWADTAGLIAGLDMVIAVDTAVAHLAGALGKPVWMLNRFDSCWRWFRQREDTPWYPSMRLFRQASRGDWAEVIHRTAETLAEYAAGTVSPERSRRNERIA